MVLNAQELDVSSTIGFAIVDVVPGFPKQVSLCNGLTVGIGFNFNRDDLVFSFNAGMFRLRDDGTLIGDATFISSSYLVLPMMVRKYFPVTNKAGFFIDAGVYPGYLRRTRLEYHDNNNLVVQIQKPHQWSMGCMGGVGYKTRINGRIKYAIGLLGQKDVWVLSHQQYRIRTTCTLLKSSFYFDLQ